MISVDLIIAIAVILIVGLAVLYIYRAKKKGRKCIGCPGKCSDCEQSCSPNNRL